MYPTALEGGRGNNRLWKKFMMSYFFLYCIILFARRRFTAHMPCQSDELGYCWSMELLILNGV
jgi:hypothetical protein